MIEISLYQGGLNMKDYMDAWKEMNYIQKTIIAFITVGIIYAMGEVKLFLW